MRTVLPIEYTVLCPNCKTRYACGITEYHQNLGNSFQCSCGVVIPLCNFTMNVVNYSPIIESLLLE